ncbi:MAG: DNA-binding transcriptional MerR regulator [Bacteroidia bacterium]|jgi:DNA-binding transcriptional MerR regulator
MSEQSLPDKLYYSISELSEHFNVAQSLLRYWEKEFSVINPKRNKKGTRFYTKKDVEYISLIYHLVKECGFTLQGARDKIKTGKKGLESKIEITNSLKNIKSFLIDVQKNI